MSFEDKLSTESDDDLQQRRRNAVRIIEREPGSPFGIKAELLLEQIDQEMRRRHLPGMIEAFLEKFPKGFDDPLYLDQERNYKLKASSYCREHLTSAAFSDTNEQSTSLLDHVRKLVGMTNMIQGSFEKPKLLDTIGNPEHSELFRGALADVLHGAGDPPTRLERFSEALGQLGLMKWTYATYFLFLSEPDACMFVKPEGLKRSLEISGYQRIDYESEPSARLYREILRFAEWLKKKLEQEQRPELKPRDMIDVQSFIWVQGSDEYDA